MMEGTATLLPLEPVQEPENDAIVAEMLPGKAVAEAGVADEPVVVCQVCFDAVPSTESVSQICQDSCHGIMCAKCVSSYVAVSAKSAPNAIVTRFNCPICVRPLNMQRLVSATAGCANESAIHTQVAAFRHRVERSCEMLCPSCHNTTNFLTDAPAVDCAVDNKMDRAEWPIEVLTTYPAFPDEIITTSIRYCNHEMTPDAFLAYLEQVLGKEVYLDFAQRLWWHTFDPERRTSLFLAAMKRNPFELTPCCDATVCFVCKRAGNHVGEPCAAYLPNVDDLAQCPQCDLMLVKGDGCSTITCFCGHQFDWDAQVAKYRLKTRTIEALKSHRRALEAVLSFLRRRVWQRKYTIYVVGQLPMFVLNQRIMNLTPILFYPPWSTTFRTKLDACMTRRRVVKQTAARRRDFQRIVTIDLVERVQLHRLMRLTAAVSQPGSVWRTSFKGLVVRQVVRHRFRKLVQSIRSTLNRYGLKQSCAEHGRAALLSSLRDPMALERLKARDPARRRRSMSLG